MDDNNNCCELCGSCDNVLRATIHIDNGPDDTIDDEAYVCMNCYTRYESNMQMFIDITEGRLILQEHIESADDMDI